jgi:hypothetical protein
VAPAPDGGQPELAGHSSRAGKEIHRWEEAPALPMAVVDHVGGGEPLQTVLNNSKGGQDP